MLKIAFRNVFRQRRRSLLTALTMLGGFVLASLSIAWGDGTYGDVIRAFTHNRLGDIQMHAARYVDNPSINATLHQYDIIGEKIAGVPHVQNWAPRVLAGAMASVGSETTMGQIIGIDPERENATTEFDRKIIAGRGFSRESRNEALLGKGLSQLLHADVGSQIVIVSQAADGSIANDLYTVVGLTQSGDEIRDRTDCYLRLADAQSLLVLPGQVHEIAVTVDDTGDVRAAAAQIKAVLNDPAIVVEPWQEFAREFYRAMEADLQGLWIMLFIIGMIVAVGVLNTVLMAVLERRREYGLLLALGTRPADLFRMVILESGFLAFASVAAGAIIALVLNYGLSIHGLVLSQPYSYGGMNFERFRTQLNLRSFLIPAATVLLTAGIVAIFPALKAARTDPARSMRMH